VVSYYARPLVTTHSKLQMVVMVASRILRYRVPPDYADLILIFVCWRTQPTSHYPFCFYVNISMVPVARIGSNGSQALLSHGDVVEDIVAYGWDGFIRRFDGFNLVVAQAFSKTFDGTRAKIRDL